MDGVTQRPPTTSYVDTDAKDDDGKEHDRDVSQTEGVAGKTSGEGVKESRPVKHTALGPKDYDVVQIRKGPAATSPVHGMTNER